MSIDRRNFLRKGLAVTGAAATAGCGIASGLAPAGEETKGGVALSTDGHLVHIGGLREIETEPMGLLSSDPRVREGVPGRRWVMVIDLAVCDGCGACTRACQQAHHLPPDVELIRVFRMQDSPTTAPYWFPKACFQCDNTPCTKVCPVGATFKRQDGIVLVDSDTCIGCRFCMAACPYSTRVFNWGDPQNPTEALASEHSPETGLPRRMGTVMKCDFCPEHLREGRLPACAEQCAMGAIYLGDENEDAVTNSLGHHVRLSDLLRDRAGYRYLEKLGTKPRVYYLPPRDRRYPAPGRAATAAPDEGQPVLANHSTPKPEGSCPL